MCRKPATDALFDLRPSPVVAFNRVVAVGFRDGPQAALEQLPALAESLGGYPLLAAVRADLLRRSGRAEEALDAYRQAIALAGTDAERRFLQRRLAELMSH